MEEHYSHYRSADGLKNAGNLLAAGFTHVTSRDMDPQIHVHCFLFNLVRSLEGKWLANDPQGIYKDKVAIGMLVRLEAIRLLREAGYQV